MLKETVGQLWVGGYHQPFSQIDLKVLYKFSEFVDVVLICSICLPAKQRST